MTTVLLLLLLSGARRIGVSVWMARSSDVAALIPRPDLPVHARRLVRSIPFCKKRWATIAGRLHARQYWRPESLETVSLAASAATRSEDLSVGRSAPIRRCGGMCGRRGIHRALVGSNVREEQCLACLRGQAGFTCTKLVDFLMRFREVFRLCLPSRTLDSSCVEFSFPAPEAVQQFQLHGTYGIHRNPLKAQMVMFVPLITQLPSCSSFACLSASPRLRWPARRRHHM